MSPKETLSSNYIGCKNFLDVIKKNKIKCKFINASSCEIFGDNNKKLSITSKKLPLNPYGKSKLKSFDITKKYRIKFKQKNYNAVIFNTESILRNKDFLIPKICLSAIYAKKFKKKTDFGNLEISREWNWCPEQVDFLYKFTQKKPQDFLLTNGKKFKAKTMLKYAFEYFKLNYKDYVTHNKKFLRKRDISNVSSKYYECLKRNSLKRTPKIYGKFLIYKLIKFYLKNDYFLNL